jgi:hypothetical protein
LQSWYCTEIFVSHLFYLNLNLNKLIDPFQYTILNSYHFCIKWLVYWTWNWFHWQIKENFDEFKSILFSENARKFKYLYFYNFISFDGHARRSLWYIYYYIISMVIAITYEREIISLSETIRNGVDYFFFIIYLFFIHQYFIVWCYLWRYCEWLVIYFYEKVSDQLEDFKFCE